MEVKLKSGDIITLVGPVVSSSSEGIIVSLCEFNVIVGGHQATIRIEDLDGAEFPQDIADRAEAAFNAGLAEVRQNWLKLARMSER